MGVALEQPGEECPLNIRGGSKNMGWDYFVLGLRVGPEIKQSLQSLAERSGKDNVVFGLRFILLAENRYPEKRLCQLCKIVVERWVGVDKPDVSSIRSI